MSVEQQYSTERSSAPDAPDAIGAARPIGTLNDLSPPDESLDIVQTCMGADTLCGRRSANRVGATKWRIGRRGVAVTLALCDLAAAAGAIAVCMAGPAIAARDGAALLAIAATLLISRAAWGLYPPYGVSPVDQLRRSGTISAGVMLGLFAAWALDAASTLTLIGGTAMVGGMLTVGPVLRALAQRSLRKHGAWGEQVWVIAPVDRGAELARWLERHPQFGLRPVGVIRPHRFRAPGIRQSKATVLCLGEKADVDDMLEQIQARRIFVLSRLPGIARSATKVRRRSHLFADGSPVHSHAMRVFEITIATVGLAVTGPLILMMAGLIRLFTGGPAFFCHERVGWRGRTIRIWKLRSMFVDAEQRLEAYLAHCPHARAQWERACKLRDDPRVIPVLGRFIRMTSIDELPQLWNILRGDMALVGPRPFPRYHVDRFPEEFQRKRQRVRPGLTGLWQVHGRGCADMQRQQELDSHYIDCAGFWLDLYILLRTIHVVLTCRGAR